MHLYFQRGPQYFYVCYTCSSPISTQDYQKQTRILTSLLTYCNQGTHTAEAQGVSHQKKRQDFIGFRGRGKFGMKFK